MGIKIKLSLWGVVLVGNCPGGSYPVGYCPVVVVLVQACPLPNKLTLIDTN